MWKEYTKGMKFPESYISMGLGFLVVVVAGLLLFNFFNKGKTSQTAQNTEQGVNLETLGQAESTFPVPSVHKVSAGETLWTIAEKYYKSGYNWVDIAKENKLTDPNTIEVGQQLKIPTAPTITVSGQVSSTSIDRIMSTSYTVQKNDDLWDIAVRSYGDGYAWVKIAQANNIVNPNTIHVGNILKIPR